MIESGPYLKLRTIVRSLKSHVGLKYEFTELYYNKMTNVDSLSLIINRETDLSFKETKNYHEKHIEIMGNNRYKQLMIFHKIYRNSSKYSNDFILFDLIHEFIADQIDTLYVPSKFVSSGIYWALFPVTIIEVNGLTFEITDFHNIAPKNSVITVEGSYETFFHLFIANGEKGKENYYLFSDKNDVFVYPIRAIK